jgi:hypothetical protein
MVHQRHFLVLLLPWTTNLDITQQLENTITPNLFPALLNFKKDDNQVSEITLSSPVGK